MAISTGALEKSAVPFSRPHRIRMTCLNAGLVGMLLLGLAAPHLPLPFVWLGTAVITFLLFCWTSCFHETVHQTLPGPKPANIRLGRMIGTTIFVPYTAYRETHIRHHAYLNTPDDWELWPYSDPGCSRTFRRVFVWIDLFCGIVTGQLIYGRIYFHRNSPLKSPEIRRAIRNEYLLMLLFWAAVLGVVAATGMWRALLSGWLIPATLAGIIQSGRKLTEHLGMASYEPLLGTRTVLAQNWLTRLGSFLNFEIIVHGVHHRHPRLSHDDLQDRMRRYLRTRPDVVYPVYTSYGKAVRAMLPFLLRNPGCGVNAGAATPVAAASGQPAWSESSAEPAIAAEPMCDFVEDSPPAPVESRTMDELVPITLREETTLSPRERLLLGDAALENFEHYARYSTERTTLFFVKAYRGEELLGLAPVVKTFRYNSTNLLRRKVKWWLVPLIGCYAERTTYMIDTGFLGFTSGSPFYTVPWADRCAVKQAISAHLKQKADVDTVWIVEPPTEAAWLRREGYDQFEIMPMGHVDLAGYESFGAFLATLSKKRRRHVREAQQAFDAGGGVVEVLEAPFREEDAAALYDCLRASSERGHLAVPYGDVVDNREAFLTQPQLVFVARQQGKIVAFLSYLVEGEMLLQCHGGLDYGASLNLRAYYHLLMETIRFALDQGYTRVSFGPLNNETKRRAATEVRPVVANLWTRVPFFRTFTRCLVIPNMQVFVRRHTPSERLQAVEPAPETSPNAEEETPLPEAEHAPLSAEH